MNTHESTATPAINSNLEHALDHIEALANDKSFGTAPLPDNVAIEETAFDCDQIVETALNYAKWALGSFVTWIAIHICGSSLVGPILRSVATIATGEATGLAAYGNTVATFAAIAFFGFLVGRDRIWAKRLCQSIIVGLLLAVGGTLWVLFQPGGNAALGLANVAAQLTVFAAAIFTGIRFPEPEKSETKKGFVRQSLSTIGGVLTGIGIVIALKFGGAYLSTVAQGSIHNGKDAPSTQYVDTDENLFTFADCKGKVTLVEFWAPWCGPCVASMPHLCEIQQQYGDRDDFVMVSIAVSSRPETAAGVFDKNGCDWKLLFRSNSTIDGGSSDQEPATNESPEFLPNGIPSAYIIDRDGKVVASGIRGSSIDSKLAELLGK